MAWDFTTSTIKLLTPEGVKEFPVMAWYDEETTKPEDALMMTGMAMCAMLERAQQEEN